MKTFKEVTGEKIPSLVVFIHAGQQDAVDIKYNIEELRRKYAGKANVLRVDASYDPHVAKDFRLTVFPTYVLMKEGQELMRESGRKNVNELSRLIDRGF